MNNEKYYWIRDVEGHTPVSEMTKDEVLRNIDMVEQPCLGSIEEIKEGNNNYEQGRPLIIKGTIVTPTAIKVVEEWEIE